MAFSDMFGDMFGGMDFSSLYGNMATQQQQNQQQYSGQSPWNNFSNFGLGSMWGDSGQHPGLGSWLSPSYSRYEAPSPERMQEFAANQQQMHQQQMEQHRQQAEQRYQQGSLLNLLLGISESQIRMIRTMSPLYSEVRAVMSVSIN